MELLWLVTGIAIGGIATWFIAKYKFSGNNSSDSELKLEKERVQDLRNQYSEVKKELETERAKTFELNNNLAATESDYRNLQERLAEQKQELKSLQEQFAVQFKNLANEIFEEKSKKFTDQNKTNLSEILNPLKEKITDFEKKVELNSKENLQYSTALKEQLTGLKELNQQMTKEAESLTKALKGDSKAQGNWGEMQIELILEKAGLQKDVHYFKEKNFKTEDNQNQRPDYIIMMPDEKAIVLDSKVSLTAYANYFDADEARQASLLKQHLDSVNGHIKMLSEKKYQNIHDINQPDYVMMFVANEPALTIALKEDQDLYEKALDKNIVLVSTTTLMATLRTISYIWKQDLQNKNAIEIARQAGALYDKFVNFSNDLIDIGKSIDKTKAIYTEASKKLYEGNDNLVRKTERLKELGAKASKSIESKLLDRAE
ncbi:MAG: DNA recombination protein RmuC [Fulvivirga sp.]|uniref:DNA recombination protein RmuC n=1 Tax=Fulvivirga sp. TaxID=1931237 RepID=UPI0032EE1CF2